MSTSSGSLFLFLSQSSTEIATIVVMTMVNSETRTPIPAIIGALMFVLLTVSSCVSLHMVSKGPVLQEEEVLGITAAGWEGTSEGVEETTTCPDRGEGDSGVIIITVVAIGVQICISHTLNEMHL